MRLPELDEQAVKVQPLPITSFSSDLSDIVADGEIEGDVDEDFLEIPMFGRDRLKCRGDPLSGERPTPKYDALEPRRSREVDRPVSEIACKQKWGTNSNEVV